MALDDRANQSPRRTLRSYDPRIFNPPYNLMAAHALRDDLVSIPQEDEMDDSDTLAEQRSGGSIMNPYVRQSCS